MDVNSINPVKMNLERPEPVVNKKGREKSQESTDISVKTEAVSQAELDKAIEYANESGKKHLSLSIQSFLENDPDKIRIFLEENNWNDLN